MKMTMSTFFLALSFGVQCAAWVKEMENPSLFEGDMVLSPDQKRNRKLGKFSYGFSQTRRWPLPIPYAVAPSLASSKEAMTAITAAITDYHKFTCLRFVKRTTQAAYINFYRGDDCSSPVGYSGARNDISLGDECLFKTTVMHEIAHSLGLYHEQSRPDRDKYVRILWKNIEPGLESKFDIEPDIDPLGTPYDFSSLMHYDATAFGGGRRTIETLDPSKQSLIGQNKGFSPIDIKEINLKYQCSTTTTTTTTQAPCVDANPVCSNYRSYCTSSDPNWIDLLKRTCPKLCGC